MRRILDKEVRRGQLVHAAIKVFAAKGYRSASIADIIEAAGVARGTFYLYFSSKLDAFHAVMDRYIELFKERVATETARSYANPLKVRQAIRESLLDWLRFYQENKDLAKIVFREATAIDPDYEKRCYDMLESCFQHWRESVTRFQKIGFVRRDVDPEFLNMVFSGVLIHVVLRHIIPERPPAIERIVDQWIEFIESGVKARSWLA
ncbi:MAG: TetR/AcrR family transcriptional regulator [Elusimicrobia bacterium]|nr:TetR/AcrR family transcriptional regulator [Elusimicrobiota bacterium]